MSNILLIASLIPFTLIFYLIIIKKWPAIKTMPLAWLITAIILLTLWKLSPTSVAASFIKGALLTIEILLIIIGAIWLLEIMKEKRKIEVIKNFLIKISPDKRIQAIIIVWLFGSLIEGVAGFGTPAAITAPLLVVLGFAPITSVVLALIANSTPVSFGGAGTPILLGLGSLDFSREILNEVAKTTALLHLIGGLIIPLTIAFIVSKLQKQKFSEIIPFAIFSSLAFTIPYFLFAYLVGPELPSIAGSIIGLLIVGFAARKNILTPKTNIKTAKLLGKKTILSSVSPYIFLVIILSLSRAIPMIKNNLVNFSLNYQNILGTGISYAFNYFFTPSFYFLLAIIFTAIIFKTKPKEIKQTLSKTIHQLEKPALTLLFILALVQLFLISERNPLEIQGMPLLLAETAASLTGQFFIILSPFIGTFGAFIAGSNTVSNLLLGSFQASTAQALGISVILILALQTVGGAIGNMIAIHNIVAASATVKLHDKEGEIIRKTIKTCLLYALIVGIAGMILVKLT